MKNTPMKMPDILNLTIPQLEVVIKEIVGDSSDGDCEELVGGDAVAFLKQMTGK